MIPRLSSSFFKQNWLPLLHPFAVFTAPAPARPFFSLAPSRFRVYANSVCVSSAQLASNMRISSHSHTVKDHVDITAKERRIFDLLLDVVRHFKLPTTLRVAGGWVRDKLLGEECYDIDIALDDMLGRQFCEMVNEYLIHTGKEARKIGLVKNNPDQSKHLETANMHLFGEQIDFVNLRSEEYSETSRIPTMNFGTPEDDAYRRDITINSLFYNLRSGTIEDFTGRGIPDLKSGKIVTPLPPKQTFLDDPLRVLRAIRFGARFGFELDGELKMAASDNDVRTAFVDKISRERVGKEIDKMVSGNQPVKAVAYILEVQLFWAVFSLPPEIKSSLHEGCERDCLECMDSAFRLIQSLECHFTDEQRSLCLYAALLLPLKHFVYKNKKIPAVSYIFCNSLKLKNDISLAVLKLHATSEDFLLLLPAILDAQEVHWKRETIDVPASSKLRIVAGLIIREIKELWRAALVLSLLLYPVNIESSKETTLQEQKKMFHCVEKAVTEMGLEGVWQLKPLLNGEAIMAILGLGKGGPLVKEWLEKQLEWQLSHPSGTAEEYSEWMSLSLASKRPRIE